MYERHCDVAVIGAGPAGLAAAAAAREQGAKQVVILERDSEPGGILLQCIHPGFGLNYFGEELTGPEYAGRFIERVQSMDIDLLLNTSVLSLESADRIQCVNRDGVLWLHPKAVVLAMGCRERTRANICIPGSRPSGVYTAGAAQRLINRQNCMVGHRVVILGSGDIGMIMARRLTLEGAQVLCVVEIMPYLSGLTRNRVQCLDDFNIPLLTSHTVVRIVGNERVEGVWVARVDDSRRPIPGTEQLYACDTLLLSVGLIPENELSKQRGIGMNVVTGGVGVDQHMQTDTPGVFSCGNVLHVNDLVDNVTLEGQIAGKMAALYALGTLPQPTRTLALRAGSNVSYVCPQRLAEGAEDEEVSLLFRVKRPLHNAKSEIVQNGQVLARRKAPKMNPGEMERLTFRTGALVEGELTVQVEGDGAV